MKYRDKPKSPQPPPGIRNKLAAVGWICTSCGKQQPSEERNRLEQNRYYQERTRYTCRHCGGTMQSLGASST